MEMHEIRYFLALCQTLNFTRAAENCNVSQPSLTRAIQNLEHEFGGPLLHRERHKTHLTELGRVVRPYLEQVLSQSQEAKQRAKDFGKLKGAPLSLGLMCTIGPQRLIPLMQSFRVHYPDVNLTLRDANAETLLSALDHGEIDVALLALPEGVPERFHGLPLYDERFLIAMAPGHRLEKLKVVRAKDLHGELYLSRINCEFGDYMLKVYAERGVELTRPYRSERDDWILSMAAAGLGFSFIPEFSVILSGLITRPLVEPSVSRQITLVTVRGRPYSPAVGAFVREAKMTDWDNAAAAA
jgi:LysR family hydrogen peroxide-inducible transcriptional activator